MHRAAPFLTLAVIFATSAAWSQTAKPTIVVVPLEVDPNPAFTKLEASLKSGFWTTIDTDGAVIVVSRKETDAAIKELRRFDFRESDEAISRLTSTTGALYGLFAALEYTPKKELVLTGRVVREDGKLMKSARVQLDKGKDSFQELVKPLTKRLIEELRLRTLPTAKEVDVVEVPVPAKPDPVISQPPPLPPIVVGPPEPARSNTAQVVGWSAAGVGLAAVISGVAIFATAPTYRKDVNGFILPSDVTAFSNARTQKDVGVSLIIGGTAIAAVGATFALLMRDKESIRAGVVVTRDGAYASIGGAF